MPTTSIDRPPLNQFAVLALAAIVQAAHAGVKVTRLMPDDHPLAGQVITGTARHIVTDERALFPTERDDIRRCYLRVTGGIGDYFWPVSELAAEYQAATFATDTA